MTYIFDQEKEMSAPFNSYDNFFSFDFEERVQCISSPLLFDNEINNFWFEIDEQMDLQKAKPQENQLEKALFQNIQQNKKQDDNNVSMLPFNFTKEKVLPSQENDSKKIEKESEEIIDEKIENAEKS